MPTGPTEVDESRGLGLSFMDGTKYRNLPPSDMQMGRAYKHPSLPVKPRASVVDLGPHIKPEKSVYEVMAKRRSLRQYAKESLSLAELSYLLWAIHGQLKKGANGGAIRTSPSAGARHPLDTYVVIGSVEGVAKGVYLHDVDNHALIEVDLSTDALNRMAEVCLEQKFIADAAAGFVWAARPYRTTYKYGDRGFRYIHLDAGHACQNLYLAAEAVGAGCCGIAAFDDDDVNEFLGLNGEDAFAVYAAVVGKRIGEN